MGAIARSCASPFTSTTCGPFAPAPLRAFVATMNRSDFSSGQTGLTGSPLVPAGGRRRPPKEISSLVPSTLPSIPPPADPAAVMTGHRVVQASPVLHRVCFGPALAAFAIRGAARLCGVCAHEAHSMGLTFVADCSFDLRLRSTCPRGHAVAAPFSAKRPNWPDETCTHGWLVFGIAPTDDTDDSDPEPSDGSGITEFRFSIRWLCSSGVSRIVSPRD